MGNVLSFPDKISQRNEDNPYAQTKMFAGMPSEDFYEVVFRANFEMLGLDASDDVLHVIEFFTSEEYPHRVLADIGLPGIRGLYSVELRGYSLLKLADEPLVHFK